MCSLFSVLGEKSGLCKFCNKRSGQKLKFLGPDSEKRLGHPYCINSAILEGFELAPAFIHATNLLASGETSPKMLDILQMLRLKSVVIGNSPTKMTTLGIQNYTNSFHYLAEYFPNEILSK